VAKHSSLQHARKEQARMIARNGGGKDPIRHTPDSLPGETALPSKFRLLRVFVPEAWDAQLQRQVAREADPPLSSLSSPRKEPHAAGLESRKGTASA
jgi:hypothetical protein